MSVQELVMSSNGEEPARVVNALSADKQCDAGIMSSSSTRLKCLVNASTNLPRCAMLGPYV